MWRILHHRGHHSCINLHGEDDALTGRGVLRFTPHEPRTRLQRFQHIYALLMYAVFSLDYVFVRDFECFFFPSHDYLKRTKHPLREYITLFAGKAFYVTYMLILPVVLLRKSPLAGRFGFRTFPFNHRLERSPRIPDHTRDRQHLLPCQTATSSITGSTTFSRPRPTTRPRLRWSVGWSAGSTTTSSTICALLYATLTMLR